MLRTLAILIIATISLSGCQSSKENHSVVDYDKVVDVPIEGWSPMDTLCYTLELTWPTHARSPLVKGIPYNVNCCIRIASSYPLTEVPMQLIVQQTDTLGQGGQERVTRNLLRKNIAPKVRDAEGRPLGSGWGSLISHEAQLDSLTLLFDSIGTYRMLLMPRTGELPALCGIASIGIQMERRH